MDASPVGKLFLGGLETALDIECQPACGHFEAFASTLSFELSVLLKRAHPEPAQRADRNQRRRGQQHRDSARLYPGQVGSILRLIVHHSRHGRVTNASQSGSGSRGARLLAVCRAWSIPLHAHHTVRDFDKSAIKANPRRCRGVLI
jgi:hypothetical protein